MKMKIKMFHVLALLVVGAMLIAACGSSAPTSAPAKMKTCAAMNAH